MLAPSKTRACLASTSDSTFFRWQEVKASEEEDVKTIKVLLVPPMACTMASIPVAAVTLERGEGQEHWHQGGVEENGEGSVIGYLEGSEVVRSPSKTA